MAHGVCPYYLSQDLVRWCDVVIGDYNYFFDVSALLHGLTVANGGRVSVLVDEAHNLVERVRKMYSGELDPADLAGVRQSAGPALKKRLDRLHRVWRDLAKDPKTSPEPTYQVRASLPGKFLLALQNATTAITDDLEANPARILRYSAVTLMRCISRVWLKALARIRCLTSRWMPHKGGMPFQATARQPSSASGAFATLCLRLSWRRALPLPGQPRCFPRR